MIGREYVDTDSGMRVVVYGPHTPPVRSIRPVLVSKEKQKKNVFRRFLTYLQTH